MGGTIGWPLQKRRTGRLGVIPTGLSGVRYARLSPQMRQHPVWARAIARLMTARGYRSQSALIAAARKHGIHLRPNTLSDAVNATKDTCPRLDSRIASSFNVLNSDATVCTNDQLVTLREIAVGFGIPLLCLRLFVRHLRPQFTAPPARRSAGSSRRQSAASNAGSPGCATASCARLHPARSRSTARPPPPSASAAAA